MIIKSNLARLDITTVYVSAGRCYKCAESYIIPTILFPLPMRKPVYYRAFDAL